MTRVVAPPPPQPKADAEVDREEGIVLEGVSWETYELLCRDLERSDDPARLIYDEGRLAIVSPRSPRHEGYKSFIGRLIELLAIETDLPVAAFGETTWKRKQLLKGCEGGECYYVQHEPRVRGRTDIDLKRDPPPDLVVEVESTRPPIEKLPIYAALGVPEVWHWKKGDLRFLRLRGGAYEQTEASVAFPMIRSSDLNRFLQMLPGSSQHQVMLAFRDWVRALPRPS